MWGRVALLRSSRCASRHRLATRFATTSSSSVGGIRSFASATRGCGSRNKGWERVGENRRRCSERCCRPWSSRGSASLSSRCQSVRPCVAPCTPTEVTWWGRRRPSKWAPKWPELFSPKAVRSLCARYLGIGERRWPLWTKWTRRRMRPRAGTAPCRKTLRTASGTHQSQVREWRCETPRGSRCLLSPDSWWIGCWWIFLAASLFSPIARPAHCQRDRERRERTARRRKSFSRIAVERNGSNPRSFEPSTRQRTVARREQWHSWCC